MLELGKLAVTGNLGVGKSTVCRYFEELGAQIFSADTIVHQLLSNDAQIRQKVVSLLGNEVLMNGTIDRQKVADKVFQDLQKLKQLEAIIHPAVRNQVRKIIQETAQKKNSLVIIEVPLLFEAGLEAEFDQVIAVTSSINRSNKKDSLLRKQRMLNESDIIARADYHIVNDGDLSHLKQSVHNIFNQLNNT